jgi:hypothetical protein
MGVCIVLEIVASLPDVLSICFQHQYHISSCKFDAAEGIAGKQSSRHIGLDQNFGPQIPFSKKLTYQPNSLESALEEDKQVPQIAIRIAHEKLRWLEKTILTHWGWQLYEINRSFLGKSWSSLALAGANILSSKAMSSI